MITTEVKWAVVLHEPQTQCREAAANLSKKKTEMRQTPTDSEAARSRLFDLIKEEWSD